ncbi:hypothetical protein TNCT_297021, partial [Trichonephila clavata]
KAPTTKRICKRPGTQRKRPGQYPSTGRFVGNIRHSVHHSVSGGPRSSFPSPGRPQRPREYVNGPGTQRKRPGQYPSTGRFVGNIRHSVHHSVSGGPRSSFPSPGRSQRPREYVNGPGTQRKRPGQYPSTGRFVGNIRHSVHHSVSGGPRSSFPSPERQRRHRPFEVEPGRRRSGLYSSRGNLKEEHRLSSHIQSNSPHPKSGLPDLGKGKYTTKFNISKTVHHPQGPRGRHCTKFMT